MPRISRYQPIERGGKLRVRAAIRTTPQWQQQAVEAVADEHLGCREVVARRSHCQPGADAHPADGVEFTAVISLHL
ncbi:MAG: hypothetical protein ACREYE_15390 [Gammaproteobacteria bacterium]